MNVFALKQETEQGLYILSNDKYELVNSTNFQKCLFDCCRNGQLDIIRTVWCPWGECIACQLCRSGIEASQNGYFEVVKFLSTQPGVDCAAQKFVKFLSKQKGVDCAARNNSAIVLAAGQSIWSFRDSQIIIKAKRRELCRSK